jgi:hypothetical protein
MQEDFELVLVRHAEAQNYSPDGDAGRRLTEAGHAAARRLGQAFVAMEWTWSHALVSPYVRAQQTCEHAQDALSELFTRIYQAPLPTPEECALLTPGGDVAQLAHRIAARGWGLVSPAPRDRLWAQPDAGGAGGAAVDGGCAPDARDVRDGHRAAPADQRALAHRLVARPAGRARAADGGAARLL